MKSSSDKKIYRDMVAAVREKLLCLPENGHIWRALPARRVDEIAERIELSDIEDLKGARFPPLFSLLSCCSISAIREFEFDVCLVVDHSNRRSLAKITQFLKAGCQDDRDWVAGQFEMFVKSRFLKEGLTVELDYLLPNGKDADIRLEMDQKVFSLECTVITDSDEDRNTWDRFIADKSALEKGILMRPGKYDSPGSRSPSDYYDCLRFYAKVYDKIAKQFDPEKSQMNENAANVLLISFYSPRASLSPTSPGVGWALDELLADQPMSGARLKDSPPGITDISILAWLDFTAKDPHRKSQLDLNRYYKDFDKIVAAPRKIGGILLFEACSFRASRVNYNAYKRCSLSHHEIARLEKLVGTPPAWWHQ